MKVPAIVTEAENVRDYLIIHDRITHAEISQMFYVAIERARTIARKCAELYPTEVMATRNGLAYIPEGEK